MEELIYITPENIDEEHICCAISDKKCKEGYLQKKEWLKQQFAYGYKFLRINARAKVFVEYGPAETAWAPIDAPGFTFINCFWVSERKKKQGYGKELMARVEEDARLDGKKGLLTVAGTKKFHFMSDGKWLLKQGFEIVEKLNSGFALYAKPFEKAETPKFKTSALKCTCRDNGGFTVYYSNRCPFTEYYVHEELKNAAIKRGIPLDIFKLKTLEDAQNCPSPATIFSLFFKGKFVTTDVSVCLDNRMDRILEKSK